MVEREHRMRFAAAEVRLELNDRITTLSCEPADGTNEQIAEAMRQKCATEKLYRMFVFGGNSGVVHERDLPEVGSELGLLVAT